LLNAYRFNREETLTRRRFDGAAGRQREKRANRDIGEILPKPEIMSSVDHDKRIAHLSAKDAKGIHPWREEATSLL
jgi:hypothetical protein